MFPTPNIFKLILLNKNLVIKIEYKYGPIFYKKKITENLDTDAIFNKFKKQLKEYKKIQLDEEINLTPEYEKISKLTISTKDNSMYGNIKLETNYNEIEGVLIFNTKDPKFKQTYKDMCKIFQK
jgi:hypothetical protein